MTSNVITLELPAQQRFANVASACVNALIERVTDGTHTAQLSHDVQLAVQEVVTNIIDHAYGAEANVDTSGKCISFRMAWESEPRQLTIDTCDNGQPFDTSRVPSAKWRAVQAGTNMRCELTEVDEPSWEQESGRGFFLLVNLMDRVVYARHNDMNHWQLTKSL